MVASGLFHSHQVPSRRREDSIDDFEARASEHDQILDDYQEATMTTITPTDPAEAARKLAVLRAKQLENGHAKLAAKFAKPERQRTTTAPRSVDTGWSK